MPDRDRNRKDHTPEPIVRLCPICGYPLPAGHQFHVPHCANMHRAELDDRYRSNASGADASSAEEGSQWTPSA